ncbi:MAG: hypothetical protein ACI9Y8_002055, partial [Candidatus Omnitrophota bacterium]
TGILNGVEKNEDVYFRGFTQEDIQNGFKAKAKSELQRQLGLAVNPDNPIISVISRIDPHQKGTHLIVSNIQKMIANGMQVVFLGFGSKDDPLVVELVSQLEALADRADYAGKLSINITGDPKIEAVELSDAYRIENVDQLIFAGSDMFMVPSKYEPMGLTQILAGNYGTLPIVRNVGGLKDTVTHLENGFTFEDYTPEAFWEMIEYALETYREKRQTWNTMIANAIDTDHSWSNNIREYAKLYRGPFEADLEFLAQQIIFAYDAQDETEYRTAKAKFDTFLQTYPFMETVAKKYQLPELDAIIQATSTEGLAKAARQASPLAKPIVTGLYYDSKLDFEIPFKTNRNAQDARATLRTIGNDWTSTFAYRVLDGASSGMDLFSAEEGVKLQEMLPDELRDTNQSLFAVTTIMGGQMKVVVEALDESKADIVILDNPTRHYGLDTPYGGKAITNDDVYIGVSDQADAKWAEYGVLNAPAYIFNSFGLSGFKISFDEPIWAILGRFEASNAYYQALVTAAVELAQPTKTDGSFWSEADIAAYTQYLENNIFGGFTGSQGVYGNNVGGVATHYLIERAGEGRRILSEALTTDIAFLQERIAHVQIGATFKDGIFEGNNQADLIKTMWVDLIKTQDPIGITLLIKQLNATHAYNAALASNDIKNVIVANNVVVDIRDDMLKRWMQIALYELAQVDGWFHNLPEGSFALQLRDNTILKDLYEKLDEELLDHSLYSNYAKDLIAAGRAAGISVFPIGPGGENATLAIIAESREALQNFLQEQSINAIDWAAAQRPGTNIVSGSWQINIATGPAQRDTRLNGGVTELTQVEYNIQSGLVAAVETRSDTSAAGRLAPITPKVLVGITLKGGEARRADDVLKSVRTAMGAAPGRVDTKVQLYVPTGDISLLSEAVSYDSSIDVIPVNQVDAREAFNAALANDEYNHALFIDTKEAKLSLNEILSAVGSAVIETNRASNAAFMDRLDDIADPIEQLTFVYDNLNQVGRITETIAALFPEDMSDQIKFSDKAIGLEGVKRTILTAEAVRSQHILKAIQRKTIEEQLLNAQVIQYAALTVADKAYLKAEGVDLTGYTIIELAANTSRDAKSLLNKLELIDGDATSANTVFIGAYIDNQSEIQSLDKS